ncbi:hypothetical protein PaG_03621 [Moesziomyces aphidis]|uniref:40S ribosomal protein S14 n=1 Tax=Moesziomyces aphidis TaxID=84754 RepID=W3VKI3_MOEAP|nr:hypothetical protein PaG_03621 [Moesziomyces aphidis]
MAPKVRAAPQEVSLGPNVGEGELVFGVAHIFASFNDTFVHVTDMSGKETVTRVTAGPVPFAPPPLPLQQCRPDHSPTHLTSLPVSARIPALTCAPYLPISTFNALR